jgi:hypothetical protein
MWTWILSLLLGAVIIGGVLWWMRRYGDTTAMEGVSWLGRQWDELRDRWIAWRDRPRGPGPLGTGTEPIPEPLTAMAAPLPPPPPPAAANGNGSAPPEPPPVHAAQSDLLYAIGALVSMASTGDIQVVRRVIKTLSSAADGLGTGLLHLGNRLAEPDKHYGHEIWEPLVQAGAQVRSAGLHCAQADAMTVSLLAVTVAELAASPRQAPHHSQLNGGS